MPDEAPRIEGELFLYDKPELLTRDKHGHLGLSPVERPFEFAASARAVPIVASEIATVQKHYPVVFSSLEDPALVAITGLSDGVNLFVGDNGQWEPGAYIPAYLRSYPFAFADTPDDRFAVVIDTASPAVSDSPVEPFFDGDGLNPAIQSKVDLFSRIGAERRKTGEFCARMSSLDLLSGQQVTRTVGGEQQSIASYVSVDAAKLETLDPESLWELHRSGLLAAVYAHIFSLDNWSALLGRHQRRFGELA